MRINFFHIRVAVQEQYIEAKRAKKRRRALILVHAVLIGGVAGSTIALGTLGLAKSADPGDVAPPTALIYSVGSLLTACAIVALILGYHEGMWRRRYGAALDSVGEGVVMVDGETRITYVNAAFERLSGRDAEALYGNTLLDVLPGLTTLDRHTTDITTIGPDSASVEFSILPLPGSGEGRLFLFRDSGIG